MYGFSSLPDKKSGISFRRSKLKTRFSKVRWLLPNDRVAECDVENMTDFVQLLQLINRVACDSLSYKVVHVELIIEEDMWICVSLE